MENDFLFSKMDKSTTGDQHEADQQENKIADLTNKLAIKDNQLGIVLRLAGFLFTFDHFLFAHNQIRALIRVGRFQLNNISQFLNLVHQCVSLFF